MTEEKKPLNIGLVMPIAPIDGCSAEHWLEVKRIISESVATIPGYHCEAKIVSEGDSVGLIHKRIIEGLYKSDIVICDVSCKNPNVMFELGIRLAFDKPTVIIKDDLTDYAFDTGVIEHLTYPRDLQYSKIVNFKELLADKVRATYEYSLNDPNHSPFLKSFGQFKVAHIKETTVTSDQFIIESLKEIQTDITNLKRTFSPSVSLTSKLAKQKSNEKVLDEISIYTERALNHNEEGTVINLADLASNVFSNLDDLKIRPTQVIELAIDYLKSHNIEYN